ncbi:thiamine phosphate synthase [soil metagenome]
MRDGARRRITGLHVLTDVREGRDALGVAAAAAAAGASVIQVRVKGSPDRALYEFASSVVEICASYDALCIVDDRVDIALASGADGTHLGAFDLPMRVARSVVAPAHLLGGTARSPADAVALVRDGADYLGVGPAYPTATKSGLPEALGPTGVAAVTCAVDVPVIAIGGIGVTRVSPLMAAGAAGVAVVSAVSDAPDPATATRALLDALGRAGWEPR